MGLLFSSQAQKGVWGWTGTVTSAKIANWKASGYTGVRIIAPWYSIQPTQSNLSFSSLKTTIALCADSALQMEIQVWVGPDAPIFTGYNWLATLGVETFMTTGGTDNGPWPNYYNTLYKNAFNTLHKALADTLFNLPSAHKQYVKSVFISNGSTGDEGPTKGTPTGESYGVANDATWNAYIKVQWDSCWKYYRKDTPFMKLTFQGNDDATHLNQQLTDYPGSNQKHGGGGHDYPLDGDIYRRNWPITYYQNDTTVYISEVDGHVKFSTKEQDHFQMIRAALDVHMQRLDFMVEWDAIPDRFFLAEFFKKYCNQYYVSPSLINKGFVALAQKVDFRDTINFPTAAFGAVYDSYPTYLSQLNLVNISSDAEVRKQVRRTSVARNRANPARMTALNAAGFQYIPSGPYYFNDIGFDVLQNYSVNITQKMIDQTSAGVFRIGDTTQSYGRNARKFKKYSNKYEMYFDVNDIIFTGSSIGDSVKITVTYLDTGYASWQIRCYKCFKKTFQNTNTQLFKQAVITIPRFKDGNKMPYSSDFIIKLFKSNDADAVVNFPVEMVEFENLSK